MWILAGLIVCIVLACPSYEQRRQTRLIEYMFDQQDRAHLRYLIESDPEFIAMTEQEKQRFLESALEILF